MTTPVRSALRRGSGTQRAPALGEGDKYKAPRASAYAQTSDPPPKNSSETPRHNGCATPPRMPLVEANRDRRLVGVEHPQITKTAPRRLQVRC